MVPVPSRGKGQMKLRRHSKIVFCLLNLVVVTVVFAYVYWTSNSPTLYAFFAPARWDGKRSGLILMWTYPWNLPAEGPLEGTMFGQCKVTYDKSQLQRADAVVFHYWQVPETWKYYRRPSQRFVWYSLENAWVVQWFEDMRLTEFDNFFNWTMTYRRDADVYYPYTNLYDEWDRLERGKEVVDKIMEQKTDLVAWLVSDCDGKKGAVLRMAYANEMMEVLPTINRYGRCFGNREEMPNSRIHDFVSAHKFYLSFENSIHCRDYITEKFFRQGLLAGTVPVVWGSRKSDYVALAPLNSFIHAEDFESPQKLAQYLLYLDKNDTAYREYFKWRETTETTLEEAKAAVQKAYPDVKVVTRNLTGFHALCHRLFHDDTHKVIPSLREEFIESEPDECKNDV